MTERKIEPTRSHKQFDGYTQYFSHPSEACNSKMNFAAYLPPQALNPGTRKFPVLYWLSGLTCSEEVFMTEAQAQAHAKKYGVILVVPDTSPRNTGIAGEDDTYDLGSGAGFYLNATTEKWKTHYQMDTYVTQELRKLVEAELPIDPARRGIFGHSMGGHGALVLGLRNPELYRSISAFAPICAPSKAPWGIKAFSEYLGSDEAEWAKYDANELLKNSRAKTPILIDQGLEDEFLPTELFTDQFERTFQSLGSPVTLRRHEGYDHSYFFISTFIEEHIAFHAKILTKF
ncbi:MAG: S-formylglutathione hydrolase [Methylotenera sp.]|nr:S-formylglutathione hydrolase [Oligoflexia bacterium]